VSRLVLIRHAPTDETGKRLTGRLPGVGLGTAGRDAAAATAAALAGLHFAAVYSSPVLRCKETARIVAAPHDLVPIPYRSLIEVDYGTWTGRTLGSLRRTKAWRELAAAPSRFRFPGGERLGEVAMRAVTACEELASVHPGETIALVAHGDVIKAALAHYLGSPVDLMDRITVDPASWSIVDLAPGGPPRVVTINHLAAPPKP
jgi:probable phosphoglycerate mutase